MFSRCTKYKSRKRTTAFNFVARVKRSGFLITIVFTRYASEKKKCWVAPGSFKCSIYTKHGGPCNIFGPSKRKYEKLSTKENKLEAEERQAEADLLQAQNRLNELFGQLSRLRSQKKLLKRCSLEMIRRGVEGAAAMEEFERLEEQQH